LFDGTDALLRKEGVRVSHGLQPAGTVRRVSPDLDGEDNPVAESEDFAAFYAAAFQPLCAVLFVHTGDLAEAQDVVQEAFCRALPRWHRLSTYDDPVAWVRKVAWNLAISGWRRRRRHTGLAHPSADQPVPEPSPDGVALRAALASLPPRQRQVIVLHYLADLPVSQIAAMTGAAEGTVKSWLHRGRAALADRLGDRIGSEEVSGGA
jgi:RNA polymerase sigma-70 factor (ECF subfamily)